MLTDRVTAKISCIPYSVYIVLAATMQTFISCGLNFSFGVYQELYETAEGPFDGVSSAEIDLVGTVAVAIMSLGAPGVSLIGRRFSPRIATTIGAVCAAAGYILASFSTRYWHFLLSQGILFGIGTCFSFITAVTVSPPWFDRHRALGMGIVLSGTGLGGLVWAPVSRALNEVVGFRNALRIEGSIAALLIGGFGALLKWDPATLQTMRAERESGAERMPLVNWKIAKSSTFISQAMAGAFQAAAYYGPLYYLSSYCRSMGYSSSMGANVIAVSNAANFVGKIALGHIADKQGRMNTLTVSALLGACTAWALWLPSSVLNSVKVGRGLLFSFSALYGVFAGAYIGLFPTVLAEQFGAQNFKSINSLLYFLRGVTSLVGTPVAGVLIKGIPGRRSPRDFVDAICFIGSLLTAAALAVAWNRIQVGLSTKWKLRV